MKQRTENDQTIAFIKFFFQKVFELKYVYIVAIILFGGIAFVYNKYAPKVYELNSTIGPLKDTRTTVLESNDMFRSGYSSSSSGRDLETAINSLSSFELVSKTVSDLNLEIGYFEGSGKLFKTYTEVYLQSPFFVQIDKTHLQTLGAKFYVKILSNTSYRITVSGKDAVLYNYIDNNIVADKQTVNYDTICKFNEPVRNKRFRFTLVTNPNFFEGAKPGMSIILNYIIRKSLPKLTLTA